MSVSRKTTGYIVQLCGLGAFALGAILSVHHVAIGALFVSGAVAVYVGAKIQSLA